MGLGRMVAIEMLRNLAEVRRSNQRTYRLSRLIPSGFSKESIVYIHSGFAPGL